MRNKLIACVLLFAFFVTFMGCSAKVDTEAEKEDTSLNITVIGASTAGTLFMVLNAIAECIDMSYPDSNVTIVPGSTGGNPSRINDNEADASVTHSITAFAAKQGNPPYNEKNENIAAIASLYSSVLHIAVDKETDIVSLEEFIDRKMKLKFSIGQPGSTSEILFKQIIAEYGITVEDIQDWGGDIVYQNVDNSAQMLVDGSIDGAVFSAFVPMPHLMEASANKDLVILKISPEVLQKLAVKYQYQRAVISAGSYPFLSEDIQSVCSHTIIIVPANSSEETAYKITKAITENLDYLKKVHVSMESLTPDQLAENLGIPLHPGAEKYYREKDIIK